jgi:hypothetical protein
VDEFGDVIQIQNLFPAPGWKVFGCAIGLEDDKAFFFEIPVIGWAVVRTISTGDDAELHDDEIKLYVCDDEGVRSVEQCVTSNSLAEQFAPGEELNEERKAEMERWTRERMAREAEYRAQRTKAKRLHLEGVPNHEIVKQTGLGPRRVTEIIETYYQMKRAEAAA